MTTLLNRFPVDLPCFRALWIVAKLVFMGALIVTLSCIGSNLKETSRSDDYMHKQWSVLPEYDHVITVRKLLGVDLEAKKEVLPGLEKPLLEPPRRALSKSRAFLKKIKYLPDLLHDTTLQQYNHRVFVTFGSEEQNRWSKKWFYENYPLRNRRFEVLESSGFDVSGWLMENVGEGDYVVVKVEAGVVEEMMRESAAVRLVDEVFLECKNQWGFKERNKSKRAYWECLSLYGRLRDEGVAVHQWWD